MPAPSGEVTIWMSSVSMNDDIGYISGMLSGISTVNTLTASIINPIDITGVTLASEVVTSPCRPATGGMHSVNSVKIWVLLSTNWASLA